MLIQYLSYYFAFVIAAALLISYLVLKMNFPAPRVVIPAVIAVIILPGLLVYLYVTYFTSIPETTVPDVAGLKFEEALQRLEALDLKGRYAGSLFNMEYPEGSVVSQQPESGRRVKAGRVINLLTSSGKRKLSVPNLLGRPAVQAKAVLAAKGLVLGEVTEDYMPELEPGLILTQDPLPGEEVATGALINITVSTTQEAEEVEEYDEEGGFWPWQ